MFWTIVIAILVVCAVLKLISYIIHRLQDPIGKARRIMEKEIEIRKERERV